MTNRGTRDVSLTAGQLLRSATMLARVLAGTLLIVSPSVSDSGTEPSPVEPGRELASDELWEFVSAQTGRSFELTDLKTREIGALKVGGRAIGIHWYFEGEAAAAVLTRRGHSSICMVLDPKPTKCIKVSENELSVSCRYMISEIHDQRAACLRETTDLKSP